MRRLEATCATLFALALLGSPLAVSAQTALSLGKTTSDQTSSTTPTSYQFRATSAGVLTLALHGDADLALLVTDEEGQTLPEGSADRDLFGSSGTEQLLVTISEPGTYRVVVRMLDNGNAKYDLGAGWIAMPALARPSDADRRPSQAGELEPGKSHEDSLAAASGDYWDWFSLTPKQAGTLTVILRPVPDSTVDLVLELYDTDMTKPLVRSDDDLQGNAANESGTIDVKAGQKIFLKVSGAGGSPNGRYRLVSSLIP